MKITDKGIFKHFVWAPIQTKQTNFYMRAQIIIKMRVLRRDVNNSLLLLIAFFLILFIVSTIYYETILRKISGEKDENDKIISEITASMVLEKLNNSERSSRLAMVDKAVLEDKYNRLVAYAESLEQEKERLGQEIIVLNSKIEYNDARMEGPVGQFRTIQSKNEEIENLKGKIITLCDVFRKNNMTVNKCPDVEGTE